MRSAYRRTDLIQAWSDPDQVRIVAAVCLLLAAGTIAVFRWGHAQLPELPAFIPVADTSFIVGDAVTATLLFTFAVAFRSRGLLALGAGYVFSGLMALAHMLAFPGGFAPRGLIGGGVSTVAWIAAFWRGGFPLAIGAYVLFWASPQLRMRHPAIAIVISILGATVAALCFSLLATQGEGLLPRLSITARQWDYPHVLALNSVLVAVTLAVLALLLSRPRKPRLAVWLVLTMAAWLVHVLAITATPGRFTLGWYFAYVTAMFAHYVVLLAMISEAGQTYSRLAISVLTIERERDSKLMTMDAVASAIAHEVKQPLVAISLQTSTARILADRAPPDMDAITRSLDEIDECIQQTYATVQGVRSLMGKQSIERSSFSLNDVAREAVGLLRSELTGQRIRVQFDLVDRLPLVHADRVQIRQVLLNLLSNAMDAMHDVAPRQRLIVIRSTSIHDGDVLLEVRDTGTGIPADQLERIFDPFFTTKESGTGLGLSLCDSIAKDHGGRLWASPDKRHGSVFHLQLPSGSGSA